MPEIAGLPFRELHLDQTGQITKHVGPFPPHITDVLVFAHGWNNDYNDAHDLHNNFFEKMVEVLLQHTAKAAVRPGLIGVFWPSSGIDEGLITKGWNGGSPSRWTGCFAQRSITGSMVTMRTAHGVARRSVVSRAHRGQSICVC